MSAPAHRHGNLVACDGRGVLILGSPGSGKSQLSLQMMALGAELVSDDQVIVQCCADGVRGSAPQQTAGLIEARGIGLLRVPSAPSARVVLVVDLDRAQAARLPQAAQMCITDVCLPLIAGKSRPNLASELMVILRSGADPVMLDPDGPEYERG